MQLCAVRPRLISATLSLYAEYSLSNLIIDDCLHDERIGAVSVDTTPKLDMKNTNKYKHSTKQVSSLKKLVKDLC